MEISEQEALIKGMEDDPVSFIETFMERKLSIKQRLFIEKTKTEKHVFAIWSRQTGKSTVIASYIIWRLLYGKGYTTKDEKINEQIAICAPIKDQLNNLFDKLRTLIDKNEFISSFIVKMNHDRIVCKNGNFAKLMSASPGAQIRGFTATCIVIDESQDITDNKYSGDIMPFGATTNPLIIEAGTPKTKNHFYRTMLSKDVCVIRQPWFECPFLSEEYVMSEKEKSPDALWRQEYLCEFIEEGVLAFPSRLFEPEMKNGTLTGRHNLTDYHYLSKIEQLNKTRIELINKLATEDGAIFTAGLDLGKQEDTTVLTIYRVDCRPIQLMVCIEFPLGFPYIEVAKVSGMFYKAYSPYEFNVDYTNEKAFGEMLVENEVPVFKHKKFLRGLIPFTTKNKTEMINSAQVLLENFQLQLPNIAEKLLSQFLNQQYETNEMGQYKYYHPTGEHDDMLWSSLLALKNVSLLSTKDIVSFVNPWERFDDDQGKSESTSDALSTTKKLRRKPLQRSYVRNPMGRCLNEAVRIR